MFPPGLCFHALCLLCAWKVKGWPWAVLVLAVGAQISRGKRGRWLYSVREYYCSLFLWHTGTTHQDHWLCCCCHCSCVVLVLAVVDLSSEKHLTVTVFQPVLCFAFIKHHPPTPHTHTGTHIHFNWESRAVLYWGIKEFYPRHSYSGI